MFRIQFGHDRNGRPRNRYYSSLVMAKTAAGVHFARTGIVVGIENVTLIARERSPGSGRFDLVDESDPNDRHTIMNGTKFEARLFASKHGYRIVWPK